MTVRRITKEEALAQRRPELVEGDKPRVIQWIRGPFGRFIRQDRHRSHVSGRQIIGRYPPAVSKRVLAARKAKRRKRRKAQRAAGKFGWRHS